ncbi:helix-turn-helix domain-containing protein [Algibacter pacificus]|uniref:helix-turn-helix domain-containing protein n=1 Tax=Algibacter pacificus TaxID=2599389 RepID=UPI0011C9B35B|nr:helix-turn-helix domain-containing protein [Algibacter pacificus]
MKEKSIPFYTSINDFLESIPVNHRTKNPMFYCMRLEEHKDEIYKAPFRRDFFFIGLITSNGKTNVIYNNQDDHIKESFLTFQCSNLIYSFYKEKNTEGYLIYFKQEYFNFLKFDFFNEFPFFNILNINLFQLENNKYQELLPVFEEVFKSYENIDVFSKVTTHKFLALLYNLKEFTKIQNELQPLINSSHSITNQYLKLVNVHYLEKRTVKEYATLLNISASHLSKTVKTETNKKALSHINGRLIKEAKSLIQFTNLSIAEIAHQLGFSDASNFGNFFRKHTSTSPLTFRKNYTTR